MTGEEMCEKTISLDDSLSYSLVLIHGQISEDVALCLQNSQILLLL